MVSGKGDCDDSDEDEDDAKSVLLLLRSSKVDGASERLDANVSNILARCCAVLQSLHAAARRRGDVDDEGKILGCDVVLAGEIA